MDYNRLCLGCFKENKSGTTICPYCGFEEKAYNEAAVKKMCLPAGTILQGKYLIGKMLGAGGFGITYLAFQLNLDRVVAIKEFFPLSIAVRTGAPGVSGRDFHIKVSREDSRELFEKTLSSFENEGKNLASINLPGVVGIHDCLRENSTAYLVMEYISGQNLKEYQKTKGGKLEERELLGLLEPVIQSLAIIHENGIIHRDISPDNLILDEKGRLVLVDFGAARSMAGLQDRKGKSLTVVLKEGYAPLEQYNSRGNQGPWTDVYALCATIYRLLTGKTPEEVSIRILNENIEEDTRKTLMESGVSRQTADAVTAGMGILYPDRIQNMPELWKALYGENVSAGSEMTLEDSRLNNAELAAVLDTQNDNIKQQSIEKDSGVQREEGDKHTPVSKSESNINKPENKKRKFLLPLILLAGVVGVGSFFIYRNGESKKAAEKQEIERIALVKAESETESEKKAREQAEAEKIAKEKAESESESERKAKEKAESEAESEKVAKEQSESERKAKEKAESEAESEKAAKAQVESERIAKEKAESEAESEKAAKAQAESERKAKEKAESEAESEKAAKAQVESERKAKEKAESEAESEKAAKAQVESERKAKEKAESEAESEKAAKAQAESERIAKEKAESEAESEKVAKAQAESERIAKEKAESKAESEKAARAQIESERVAKEKAESEAESEKKAREQVAAEEQEIDKIVEQADELYKNSDFEKAFELFQKAAGAGNAYAMYRLGDMYGTGTGVEQDAEKALECYENAIKGFENKAEEGDTEAMVRLAYMYFQGYGVDKDYEKAVELYQKAAESGDASAMTWLGIMYHWGYGVKQDYEKAVDLFEKAMEAGDVNAIYQLGSMYYEFNGIGQDFGKAMELYEKAAEVGDPTAMIWIGIMYENGNGVEKDYEKAAGWVKKAVEAGHYGAMIHLGNMYFNGTGVEQNYEKALEWYRKAAEAGRYVGMEYVGRCYIDGTGVTADSKEALRWFTRSVGAGNQSFDETYRNKAVQGTLNSLGYDCGTPDGAAGVKTRNAVRSFRRDYGMEDSDLIDLELMKKILEVAENS